MTVALSRLSARHLSATTTLYTDRKGRPTAVSSSSSYGDAVEEAAQWLGHILEEGEWEQRRDGEWVIRVWFNDACECLACR